MNWNERKKKAKIPQLGSYVITSEGRTGRWVDITREGMAVVVSGYDTFVLEPCSLQVAFEKKSKAET